MKTQVRNSSGFKTVFCCSDCLQFVKFSLINVNAVNTKICVPCTNDRLRRKNADKMMKVKVTI